MTHRAPSFGENVTKKQAFALSSAARLKATEWGKKVFRDSLEEGQKFRKASAALFRGLKASLGRG